jgi:hypothetical protein
VNALVDALRTRWTTNVVGYDLRVQVGMLRRLASWANELRRASRDSARHDDDRGALQAWPALKRSLRHVALALVAGVLLYLVWRTLTRVRSAVGNAATKRAITLYSELERALGSRGHPRPPSVTPLEHARALRQHGFPHVQDVDAVTARYLEARFGGRPLRNAEVAELRKAIARVRKAA